MKQPSGMREAGTMLKERLLDRRVEKLSRENDQLRDELDELKHELDSEHERSKETLHALSKARKPGRMKWIVLAGGAYVLGAKAGRARYEQMMEWVRSMRRPADDGSSMAEVTAATGATGTGTTGATGTTGSTGTTTSSSTRPSGSGSTGSASSRS